MAFSHEIQVVTFAIDETTIFEIKAMIVFPFVSWLTKLAVRCQQSKSTKIFLGYKTLGFFSLSRFGRRRRCRHGFSSSLVVLPHKTILDTQGEDFVKNR